MTQPIALHMAVLSSFPSGTGSYSFRGAYDIVVANLAYDKQVSVVGTPGFGAWQGYPASFVESLGGDCELWRMETSVELTEFALAYTVGGTTYWDNNGWANYHPSRVTDELSVLLGAGVNVVVGPTQRSGTDVHLNLGVRNLAYGKQVGIVYTTDSWATAQVGHGSYASTLVGGTEVWDVDLTADPGSTVELAAFAAMAGETFWDNRCGRNYTVAPHPLARAAVIELDAAVSVPSAAATITWASSRRLEPASR